MREWNGNYLLQSDSVICKSVISAWEFNAGCFHLNVTEAKGNGRVCQTQMLPNSITRMSNCKGSRAKARLYINKLMGLYLNSPGNPENEQRVIKTSSSCSISKSKVENNLGSVYFTQYLMFSFLCKFHVGNDNLTSTQCSWSLGNESHNY